MLALPRYRSLTTWITSNNIVNKKRLDNVCSFSANYKNTIPKCWTLLDLCHSWTDVQNVFLKSSQCTNCDAACALYRLGQLDIRASKFQKEELRGSKLLDTLSRIALKNISEFGDEMLVMLLDAYAMLNFQPCASEICEITNMVLLVVKRLDSQQLPRVIWSLNYLGHKMRNESWEIIEEALANVSNTLTGEGLILALEGFRLLGHTLQFGTLYHIEKAFVRVLNSLSPGNVMFCVHVLNIMKHQPGVQFLQAVEEHSVKYRELSNFPTTRQSKPPLNKSILKNIQRRKVNHQYLGL